MSSKRFLYLALILALIVITLACRTAETIAQLRPAPSSSRPRAARTATHRPTSLALEPSQDMTPTAILAITDEPPQLNESEPPPQNEPDPQQNEPEPPQDEPPPPPPIRQSEDPPTAEPTIAEVPQPTAVSYAYRIRDSRCGPNGRTFIEGFVYEGSIGKNDLLVRISQGPDGQPDPNDDFRTGSDSSKGKGYYFHNINIGAPHGGTWYLWVIDPATSQRVSEIAIVKTDSQRVEDSGDNAGSCQSATVNFTTQAAPPTREPTNTPSPDEPTPEPTQDTGNDSD